MYTYLVCAFVKLIHFFYQLKGLNKKKEKKEKKSAAEGGGGGGSKKVCELKPPP